MDTFSLPLFQSHILMVGTGDSEGFFRNLDVILSSDSGTHNLNRQVITAKSYCTSTKRCFKHNIASQIQRMRNSRSETGKFVIEIKSSPSNTGTQSINMPFSSNGKQAERDFVFYANVNPFLLTGIFLTVVRGAMSNFADYSSSSLPQVMSQMCYNSK